MIDGVRVIASNELWVNRARRWLYYLDSHGRARRVSLDTLWSVAERVDGRWLVFPCGHIGWIVFSLTAVADAADLHARAQ